MQLDKVCVLLSTYNGEKYLKEQIDSILRQLCVDVQISIRDDGSSDKTEEIIHHYVSSYPNISFIRGNNLGPAQSFLALIRTAPEAEFYAFSDQDDIWEANKLFNALVKIKENLTIQRPILYYSSLIVADEAANPIKKTSIKTRHYNKFTTLVDNQATGCTMVFNKALLNLIAQKKSTYITMHDAWLNIVCSFFGDIVTDENSYIRYRQHGNNAIGIDTKFNFFEWIHKHFFRLRNRNFQPRLNNAISFFDCYHNELSDYDTKKLLKIINYKRSFLDKMKLFFDFSIRSYSLQKDLRYRFLILLGEI